MNLEWRVGSTIPGLQIEHPSSQANVTLNASETGQILL